MQELFLSGGGHGRQTIKLDSLFVSRLPKNNRVLFIAVARIRKPDRFGESWSWFHGDFSKLGVKSFDMWTDLAGRSYNDLSRYDAVYIGGGNTFDLLHQMRAAHFDKLLFRFLASGKPIFGGSAGAIIWGKYVHTAEVGNCPDENIIGLKNWKAFNRLHGYSVHCHYTKKDDAQLFHLCSKLKKIIALPEETGLHIHKNKIKVIGKKAAHIFTSKGKRVVKPNHFI